MTDRVLYSGVSRALHAFRDGRTPALVFYRGTFPLLLYLVLISSVFSWAHTDMAFGGIFLLLDTPWLFLSACAIGVWGLGGIAHEMYTPDLASMEDVVGFSRFVVRGVREARRSVW